MLLPYICSSVGPRTHEKVYRPKSLMEMSETEANTDVSYTRYRGFEVTGFHCILTRKLACCYGWSGEEMPPALSNTKEKWRRF